MTLAELKGCWLKDLDEVPSSELPYWIAYYEIKQRSDEKRRRKEERKHKRR